MERTQCPNCRSSASCHPFYEVRGVPTNSCLLVDDRGRALDFPTGDIMLAVCGECGFIFNAAWDPDRTIYSDQYEETQGFSPTFNAFNRAIAEELNIGLDALVFVDDSPFERELVRRELPMVAVPDTSGRRFLSLLLTVHRLNEESDARSVSALTVGVSPISPSFRGSIDR